MQKRRAWVQGVRGTMSNDVHESGCETGVKEIKDIKKLFLLV